MGVISYPIQKSAHLILIELTIYWVSTMCLALCEVLEIQSWTKRPWLALMEFTVCLKGWSVNYPTLSSSSQSMGWGPLGREEESLRHLHSYAWSPNYIPIFTVIQPILITCSRMFYKVTVNADSVNTKLLLPRENDDYVPSHLRSHFCQLINIKPGLLHASI